MVRDPLRTRLEARLLAAPGREALWLLGDAIGRAGDGIANLGGRVAELGHAWSDWWCRRWEARDGS